YEAAILDCNQAIRLNPTADFYFHRSCLFNETEQYHLAIQDFNQAIRLNTDDGAYYTCRGRNYREIEQDALAFQDFFRAFELNKNSQIRINNLKEFVDTHDNSKLF